MIVPAFLAFVWVGAATIRPTSTFHLAPVLVTLAPFAIAGPDGSPDELRRMATVGAAISLASALGIALVGWSRGPSLLPVGDALVEAVVFTLGSAALGVALASRRRVSSG